MLPGHGDLWLAEEERRRWEDEPEPTEDVLFLDEEGQIEDVEARFGCKMKEMDEDDLIRIVREFRNQAASEAKWDARFERIVFLCG